MRRRIAGFTLIEMIISIILISIVSGLLASIIGVNFKILSNISDRKKLITRGLQAAELFRREAGLIKSTSFILTATDTHFRFTDPYGNTWEYVLTGTTLTRQQVGVGSAMLLATPILGASSSFSYTGADNSDLGSSPTLSQINLITLKLVMDDGESGTTLLTAVYPENFKIFNHQPAP